MTGLAELAADLEALGRSVAGEEGRSALERLVDEELCAAWRRTPIPVRTGAMREALTSRRSANRRVTLRHRGTDVEITVTVDHPAVDLIPEVDVLRAVERAWARHMEAQR